MKCKKHGELNSTEKIKSGMSGDKQKYKCKKCMKELHEAHYKKNKDKVSSAHKKYNESDPERIREIKNASKRKMYQLNKDKERKRKKIQDQKNPGSKIARQKRFKDKAVQQLDDVYVKQQLVRGTLLKHADIPQSLVDAKKTMMMLKRSIKDTQEKKRQQLLKRKINEVEKYKRSTHTRA